MPTKCRMLTSKKRLPCSICGNTDGKCSVTADEPKIWFCFHHTHEQDQPIEQPTDGHFWKWLGTATDSLWAKWLYSNSSRTNPDQSSENSNSKPSKSKKNGARKSLEPYKTLKALPPAQEPAKPVFLEVKDRNRLYEILADHLTLAEVERENLEDQRGIELSQALAWGFRSVEPQQDLPEGLRGRYDLPGIVNRYGKDTLNTSGGCLCPVRDHLGQIQAYQVRMREKAMGGRYRWLSSPGENGQQGASPHLDTGELPLAVCRPLERFPEAQDLKDYGGPVGLTEGTGAKPFLTAQRLGIPIIGSSGGNWSGSPKALKAALDYFQPAQLVLFPDGGSSDNRDVLKKYWQVFQACKDWGYKMQFAWWGQHIKDSPECDEISPEVLQQAYEHLLRANQYWPMVKGRNLEQVRQVCNDLGISPEVIPAAYNRRLNPGPVRVATLPLGELVYLRSDLEDRLERGHLVTRLTRQLRRQGESWETLKPWLAEKRFASNPETPIDLQELQVSRWPKTKDLRWLSMNLDAALAEVRSKPTLTLTAPATA